MPFSYFMFQMVLRRILVQIRRLLHDREWSKSLSTGLLDNCITVQFLHRPLPQSNASCTPNLYSIRITCIQSILAARNFYAYGIAPECITTLQRQNF
jgi:hypothetical protein